MTIHWRNVPARAWLWWHQTARPRRRHWHLALTGPIWHCSCGSAYKRRRA